MKLDFPSYLVILIVLVIMITGCSGGGSVNPPDPPAISVTMTGGYRRSESDTACRVNRVSSPRNLRTEMEVQIVERKVAGYHAVRIETEATRHLDAGSSLIAQQLAYVMLVQALRLHVADGSRGGVGWLFALADKQMSAAITCMHDDPGHSWTLQNLAECVGMSRSVFALKFKETVGATPMEYLTRWRMLLAGDRLKNTDDSISAIALSLGYESESAFGKAFKRVMGCSPRQYGRGEDPASASRSEGEAIAYQLAPIAS